MRELSEDVKISRFHLEKACEDQADIYHHWAGECAELRATRDRADNRLKLRKAEVSLALRRNPPEGVKVTESSIDALVTADPEIQELEDALVVANKSLSVAEGAVRAMDHRKAGLDNLVRLYLAGYYQDPNRTNAPSPAVQSQRAALNNKNNAN